MGLDLALGALVLLAAVRGWFRGFMIQAIRLSGLIACVYVAEPLRDQVKPYVLGYLPTIRPDLVDRLLWWSSAAVSYVVIVGIATLMLAASRRQAYGLVEPNRRDQFAGLGFGLLKGVLVASFVVAGLSSYGEPYLAKIDWADGQKKESMAWDWNERYHPAARVWTSRPVQNFVAQVQRMGLRPPGDAAPTAGQDEETPVQTASRAPTLEIERGFAEGHGSPADLERLLGEVEKAVAESGNARK